MGWRGGLKSVMIMENVLCLSVRHGSFMMVTRSFSVGLSGFIWPGGSCASCGFGCCQFTSLYLFQLS